MARTTPLELLTQIIDAANRIGHDTQGSAAREIAAEISRQGYMRPWMVMYSVDIGFLPSPADISERWADSIDCKLSAVIDLGSSLPAVAHVEKKLEYLISQSIDPGAFDDFAGIDIDEVAHAPIHSCI